MVQRTYPRPIPARRRQSQGPDSKLSALSIILHSCPFVVYVIGSISNPVVCDLSDVVLIQVVYDKEKKVALIEE